MKKLSYGFLSLSIFTALTFETIVEAQEYKTATGYSGNGTAEVQQPLPSYQNESHQTLRIGIVNTKKCLEESKLGKQEQANFEKMKKQMESVLQEKERTLEELESKLNDDDYMDSISDDAASELKRQKRSIRNEGMQLQSQYMQTLQQANVKVIQKLTDAIGKASAQVAKDSSNKPSIDVIFTDEACTFYAPHLDVSSQVVAKMNMIYEAEQKENASKSR